MSVAGGCGQRVLYDDNMSPTAVCVKEELECDGAGEAAGASLYVEHEVKRELVLGLEVLQPHDLVYVFEQSVNGDIMVTVKHELAADEDPLSELPGEAPYGGESCEEQYPLGTCFVKLEPNPVDEELFACPICRKTFVQKSCLTSHICSEEAFCSNNVMSKKVIKHCKQKKMYMCGTCGKWFGTQPNLIVHCRIHTGEKPYACENCEKQFTDWPNFARHRLIHTGEKPYSCTICKRQFKDMSNLARHKLVHTGEKPYSCEICMKRFTHRYKLTTHQLTHRS